MNIYTDTLTRNPQNQSAHEKSNKNQYLSKQEHDFLFNLFSPKSWSLCTTVCQVLEGHNGRWSLREAGILCFVKDHQRKSFFFRLYDLDKNRMAWEMELYLEISLEKPTDKLITFDGDTCRIGLNFSFEDDCNRMHATINEKVCRRQNKTSSANHSNLTSFNPQTSSMSGAISKMDRLAANANKFGNRLMEGLGGDVNLLGTKTKDIPGSQVKKDYAYQRKQAGSGYGKKKGFSKADIGPPTDFKVVSGYTQMKNQQNQERKGHQPASNLPTGLNSEEDFQKWMVNCMQDPAIADLLANVGISERNMQKGQNAQVVYDFVTKRGHKIQDDYNRKTMMKKPTNAPPPIPRPSGMPPPVPAPSRRPAPKFPPPSVPGGSSQAKPPPPPGPAPPSAGGAPPPPPPPPPIGGSGPPAPPPMSLPSVTPSASSNSTSHKPKTNNLPPVQDSQAALMEAIRKRGGASGAGLKKVEENEININRNESLVEDNSGDMAAQLKKQLEEARKFMSDSEEEEDSDSEWDESD